jgi:hypothetical protein
MSMSFAIRNLSVLAYANGFTLWHYKTADELASVSVPNYFAQGGDMIASGDMVMLSAADGARIVCAANVGGAVTTAALC